MGFILPLKNCLSINFIKNTIFFDLTTKSNFYMLILIVHYNEQILGLAAIMRIQQLATALPQLGSLIE